MIVDFISPSHLPQFIVWLDWQLYAHGDIYIGSTIVLLLWRLTIPKKYRVTVPSAIIISLLVFSFVMLIMNGSGVG